MVHRRRTRRRLRRSEVSTVRNALITADELIKFCQARHPRLCSAMTSTTTYLKHTCRMLWISIATQAREQMELSDGCAKTYNWVGRCVAKASPRRQNQQKKRVTYDSSNQG